MLKEKSVTIQEKLNSKIKNLESLDLNFDFRPDSGYFSEAIGKIILKKKLNEQTIDAKKEQATKVVNVKKEKINENLNATILSGSSDNTIKIWDASSGNTFEIK